jgi:hypothetical protein
MKDYVEILKDAYWSKSEAFLLPLTGLTKSQKYHLRTYLFWNEYSIENFNLILKFSWDNYEEFVAYCRRSIFPKLDENGYLIETHDFDHETVMILDLSVHAMDIEMFLKGKYSKMSRDAKDTITEFHTFYDKGPKILIEISTSLNPNDKYAILGNQTAIEYAADTYGLPLDELKKVGELGGIYDEKEETLILNEQNVENGLERSV